jgi:hypothetical protein
VTALDTWHTHISLLIHLYVSAYYYICLRRTAYACIKYTVHLQPLAYACIKHTVHLQPLAYACIKHTVHLQPLAYACIKHTNLQPCLRLSRVVVFSQKEMECFRENIRRRSVMEGLKDLLWKVCGGLKTIYLKSFYVEMQGASPP